MSFSSARAVRRVVVAVLVGLLTVTGWGLAPSPASAAGEAPTGLAPAASVESEIPALSWTRVSSATGYEVQVSTSSTFTSLLASGKTINRRWVPTAQIPGGIDVHWRVRAQFGAAVGDWSEATFRRATTKQPDLVLPLPAQQLESPRDPVQFSWTAIRGAIAYDLEVGTDSDFVDSSRTVLSASPSTTTYSSTKPLAPGPYSWRVRARLSGSFVSDWSVSSSFRVLSMKPARLTAPVDDPNGTTPVTQVALDWEPVDGAVTYDLQYGTDEKFLSNTVLKTKIKSTRYSPPATLNNDQYYWRVRPVDAANQAATWDPEVQETWHFRRYWPDQPTLQYPPNQASVGDPFYFQWTPTRLASSYTLQLSTSSSFPDTNLTQTCVTDHTTYTPGARSQTRCQPAAFGTYYWRVVANDEHLGSGPITQAVHAEVHRFTYEPTLVTQVAPESGSTVTVPTLRWQPLPRAAKYDVTITPLNGDRPITARTASSSYTPRVLLKPGSYRWSVQALSEDGRLGAALLAIAQPIFEVVSAPPASSARPNPTTAEAQHSRFPTLTWTPVQDATAYQVRVRRAGATAWSAVPGTTAYPATQDLSTTFLSPDDYEWYVEATVANNPVAGGIGRFTIAPPTQVTGQRVALSGLGLDDADASCGATPLADCQDLTQTPVLRWDASPSAGYYRLFVARDAELTNILSTYPVEVYDTVWTPPDSFADSNAGSAYFWYVQPCTAAGVCASARPAQHQFNLLSNPVVLDGPMPGAPAPAFGDDDLELSWHGYLDSAEDQPRRASTPSAVARTEARYYRVQTSTTSSFTTLLDNELVDQTTYTAYDRTWPEGDIFWRVQAYDGASNPLAWSEIRKLKKASPVPAHVSPLPEQRLGSDQRFQWEPTDHAASYQVEVYLNDGNALSVGNRVVTGTTNQVSFTPSVLLPATQTGYRWRVRRFDADARPGDWSQPTTFRVPGAAPALVTPAPNTQVNPRSGYFAWTEVDDAASYRFERRTVGSLTASESVTTSALAWAPAALLPGAPAGLLQEWRATALDARGNPLGASAWQQFRVIDRLVAASPVITGSAQVGSTLTAAPVTWNIAGAETSYQWFRGSIAIEDATTSSYKLLSEDLGQQVRLVVTGRLDEYPDGTVESAVVRAGLGAGPSLARDLVLDGTGRTESVVSGVPVWQQTGVTTAYQWLIGGIAVSGATTPSFTVRSTDAGKTLQLRATGTRAGYSPTTVTSNTLTVTGGERLVATAAPQVSGIARSGSRLTASPGTWSRAATYGFQWLRDGVAIPGSTAATHLLSGADAGKLVSVRVTARQTGLLEGTSTSNGLRVVKLTSTTSHRLAATRVRASVSPRTTVTVTAPAGASRTGTVSVYDGTKVLRKVSLTPAMAGRVVVTLPRLARGRHYLSVAYAGNAQVLASRSARVLLTVVR